MTNNADAIDQALRSLENFVSEIKSDPRHHLYIRLSGDSLREADTAIQNAKRYLGRP